jgi:hypothetical protein
MSTVTQRLRSVEQVQCIFCFELTYQRNVDKPSQRNKQTFTRSSVEDDEALRLAFEQPCIDANKFIPAIIENVIKDVKDAGTGRSAYNTREFPARHRG